MEIIYCAIISEDSCFKNNFVGTNSFMSNFKYKYNFIFSNKIDIIINFLNKCINDENSR